jgi:acylphosphatase
MAKEVKAHIFFSGRVQGVGFRYTTRRFAHSLKIFGWVKNLNDGRVEIMAEAPESNIDMLCKELESSFEYRFDVKKVNKINNEFNNFEIRF